MFLSFGFVTHVLPDFEFDDRDADRIPIHGIAIEASRSS